MRDSLTCLKLYVAVAVRQRQNPNGSFIPSTLNPGANKLLPFVRVRKPTTHCPPTTVTPKANGSPGSAPAGPAKTEAARAQHETAPTRGTAHGATSPHRGRAWGRRQGVVPHSCPLPNTTHRPPPPHAWGRKGTALACHTIAIPRRRAHAACPGWARLADVLVSGTQH